MKNFPYILKQLRTKTNLTQEQLGSLINVSRVSVSGYENGIRIPDVETLIKLADVFAVPLDVLIGREVKYF